MPEKREGQEAVRRRKRSATDSEHPDAASARARVQTIIDQVPAEVLVNAIKQTPSLRGMMLGYVAEIMFETHVLRSRDGVSDIRKHNDHDRTNNKCDRDFIYCGRRYAIQLKSIQTNSIKYDNENGRLIAVVQNDGSDRRKVKLPNGNVIETTNYRVGDYDILAVPLFPFSGDWSFAYKTNANCRRSTSNKYLPDDRQHLLATTESISYPLTADWTRDLGDLLLPTLGSEPIILDVLT